MITSGIEKQVVKFVIDPNMGYGTVCQIGDCWFYFGGLEAEEMNPKDYVSNVPTEDIVNEIFVTLQDFAEDEGFKDEYDYYESILSKEHDMNWFQLISERLRDYSDGDIWSDGGYETYCKTESAANAISDLLWQLYASAGENVTVVTGYYDPEEDRLNGEEDRCTGWWYVNIE